MSESRTIFRHALTVLVGQLAVMAFGMTDTIVAGRYSTSAIAALSVGGALYISVFVGLNGIVQALLPVWAELHGARRPVDLGRSVRQSLYLIAILVVFGGTLLLFPGPILQWTEVPPALQGEVRAYLGVLTLALPASMLFRLYGTLNQSIGEPRAVTRLQALSLVLKVPLTVWFVFGGLGLPAMGAPGCALATVVVQYAMVGVAAWLVRTQPMYRPYEILHAIEPPRWREIAAFARLGVPAGLSVMVEVTSFTLMALFIARQGAIASASHQIAGNLAAFLYMVPLSLSIATSARVSFWLGAGDPAKSRHAMGLGLRMVGVMALSLAAALFVSREALARIYSDNPEVVAGAAVLLGWTALYHLGDATQVICVFLLRCFRVTVAPLVAYCVLLWGVGLGGGYALAYTGIGPWEPRFTPEAFWIAGAFALTLLGLILPPILWRAERRATLPTA